MLPLLLFLAADLPLGGISHVGFRVADIEKTRAFYSSVLGIEQAFDQKDASGKTTLAVFQIDKDEFLEFSPGIPAGTTDRFTHIAFLTDKLESAREVVQSLGLNPPELRTGRDRTQNFSIKDPDGHRVEFVRYEVDSLQAAARAKFTDNPHGAIHLKRVGIAVADRELALKFFRDSLGVDRYINLLAPGAATRLYFEVANPKLAGNLSDPDGTPIELVVGAR
jgi:catechol 2,3-dioxygenase-like lactoylglutathione lyase family enzyme